MEYSNSILQFYSVSLKIRIFFSEDEKIYRHSKEALK